MSSSFFNDKLHVGKPKDTEEDIVLTPLVDTIKLHEMASKQHDTENDMMNGKAKQMGTWTLRRDGFLLQQSSRPFCLEVFCGSARYTKALRALGADAWGIDWKAVASRLSRQPSSWLT